MFLKMARGRPRGCGTASMGLPLILYPSNKPLTGLLPALNSSGSGIDFCPLAGWPHSDWFHTFAGQFLKKLN